MGLRCAQALMINCLYITIYCYIVYSALAIKIFTSILGTLASDTYEFFDSQADMRLAQRLSAQASRRLGVYAQGSYTIHLYTIVYIYIYIYMLSAQRLKFSQVLGSPYLYEFFDSPVDSYYIIVQQYIVVTQRFRRLGVQAFRRLSVQAFAIYYVLQYIYIANPLSD